MSRVRRFLLGLLIALLAGPFGQSAPETPRFEVSTTNGIATGTLRALADDGTLEIDADKRTTFGPPTWYALRVVGPAQQGFPQGLHLVTTAGDHIPVSRPRIDNDRLIFEHPDLDGDKPSSLALGAVSLLWWDAPVQSNAEVLQRRLLRESRKEDLVLLHNGDRVTGVPTRLDAFRLTLQAENGDRALDLKQVACLALNSDLAEKLRPEGRYYQVVFSTGDANEQGANPTRLALATLTSDGQTLGGQTLFGATLRIPLNRVLAVDVLQGPADYLTDRKPSATTQTPYLDLRWPLGIDSTPTDRDLRVGEGVFARGLGLAAGTSVTYPLDGKYRRFEATVGLDPRSGREGAVRLEIRRDGKPVTLEAPDLIGAATLRKLAVDITDVKELTLAVRPGKRGPVQGHVNWIEARLVK